MNFKRWIVSPVDKKLAEALAEACDVDPFVALIAAARGYTDEQALEEFLSDDAPLSDPFELPDMEKAVACIEEVIASGGLIAIYGDYDCDGVTATALLYRYLTERNARVIYYIPEREADGYGMNAASIEKLHGMGVDLIITVDNGINAVREAALAAELGLRLVITDHHLPAGQLPTAAAVVDPHREDSLASFRDYAGVGVAFCLACALEGWTPEEMLERYGDLVAVGTVADVMPLVGDNRTFVRAGVPKIESGENLGLLCLRQVAETVKKPMTVGEITFSIAPRLNAAGRMGSARRAVELLTATRFQGAKHLARELHAENLQRQQLEQDIVLEAVELIEKDRLFYDRVIVVAKEGWQPGIIGIAASKLVERYGRPVIICALRGEIATGSGRSIAGFSLFDAISAAQEFTLKFGGHALAAGVTLRAEKIEDFRRAVNAWAMQGARVFAQVHLDCRLNPAALSVELAQAVVQLAPFGVGNPRPLFGIFGVRLEKITSVGAGKHLRLLCAKGDVYFRAICFGVQPQTFAFNAGDVVDLAVSLGLNDYEGETLLSIQVHEIRASGVDQEMLLSQSDRYECFCRGLPGDYTDLIPTREEIALLYRDLMTGPRLLARQNAIFISQLPYGKLQVAIRVLLEFGLAELSGSGAAYTIKGVRTLEKKDLESSRILQKLKRG